MKKIRWLFHPITFFVLAQISWGLLMIVWIRWYLMRNQEIDIMVQRFAIKENFGTGQWIILVEGCILMGVILVALFMVFVSQRKQVRLNKLKDSIMSSVTHELKTPLASIKLYLETMVLRTLSEEERIKFLKRSLSEADRLQKLIDSVLISARSEVKRSDKELEYTDIVELATAAFMRSKERFAEKRTFLLIKNPEAEENGFMIRCNPHQIAIVFDNLIDNAVKYTHQGGKITVQVDISPEMKFKARISDDGMGMEKQHLKKIFNKFYRIERNAILRVHGSGLGLFVCHSIVKSHQGRLYAHSDGPDKGANFYVEFERNTAPR